MNEMTGQKAELRFTIEITRAETGETETVELVGIIDPDGDEEETE